MSDRFDLKGTTPESWDCIGCGINTAPGMPGRIEIERRYNTSTASKTLSATGKAPPLATMRFDDRCEVYTVRDSVWRRLGWGRWAAAFASAAWSGVWVAG